jgi:DNA-binding GntR family transcriptional regulator
MSAPVASLTDLADRRDAGRYRSSPVIKLPRELLISHSPVPAYHRLATQLRELIDRGAFQPGEQLPSEERIAEHLHVSRPTVRHALQELERARLIRRRAGVGTFVDAGPARTL